MFVKKDSRLFYLIPLSRSPVWDTLPDNFKSYLQSLSSQARSDNIQISIESPCLVFSPRNIQPLLLPQFAGLVRCPIAALSVQAVKNYAASSGTAVVRCQNRIPSLNGRIYYIKTHAKRCLLRGSWPLPTDGGNTVSTAGFRVKRMTCPSRPSTACPAHRLHLACN